MKGKLRALIVDDLQEDARLLVRELKRGGYDVDYQRVETAETLREALAAGKWDLILCDYAFPQFSGEAALRIVRESGLDLPFIFVSGTIGEETAVEAMKMGAHDYVMKGNLARLAAAVERELGEAKMRLESRQAEAMMRASESKYRHLFENMNDAALLVSEEGGRIIDINRRTESLFGRTRAELLGMKQSELYPRPEEWTPFPIPAGADAGTCEVEIRRKDGGTIATDIGVSRLELHGRKLLLLLLRDVTARRESEKVLRSSREQLRALAARLQAVREEERTRVAREIHDELGQMLTALKMDLRSVEHDLEGAGDVSLNPVLEKIVAATELTDGLANSVQRIAAELRPGILDRLGLVSALAHESNQFQQRTGIACDLKTPAEEPQLAAETVTAVFRIFQEAMTNVTRHANASAVEVELRFEPGSLLLEIRDNGKGMRAADLLGSHSLGVLGMKERARQLGGDVVFRPAAGGGTVVALQIPNPQPRTEPC